MPSLASISELAPLLQGAAPPHGTHVDQAVPELDERAPLDRQRELAHVLEAEVDDLLALVLSEVVGDALLGEEAPPLVRDEPVFGEDEVEPPHDLFGSAAHLLRHLLQIGPRDQADGDIGLQPLFHELLDVAADWQSARREGAIDVEKGENLILRELRHVAEVF